jgi:hypothetical protein
MPPSAKSTPAAPAQQPLPIQRYQVTADDFKNPARLNVFLSQLTGAVQSVQGAGGPSMLPSGVDVQGARVTGLAAPEHPSDAISSGHAQSQFSAETLSPQLDIGGKNALKGLTGLQINSTSQAASIAKIQATLATGVSGTVTLVKLTSGGANGSLTFTAGLITAFTAPT